MSELTAIFPPLTNWSIRDRQVYGCAIAQMLSTDLFYRGIGGPVKISLTKGVASMYVNDGITYSDMNMVKDISDLIEIRLLSCNEHKDPVRAEKVKKEYNQRTGRNR